MASPLLDGDGSYSSEIVGEARRQAELRSICGVTDADMPAGSLVEQECLALLVPTAADRNDVGVEINGRHVGSLSRSDAAEYHQALSWADSFHQTFACRALISGTWSDEGESALSVGLDLLWPPRLASAVEEDRFEPADDYPPVRRRWRGLTGTWLAGAAVSLVLVLGLWLLPSENGRESSRTRSASTEAAAPAASSASTEAAAPAASSGRESPPEEAVQAAAGTPGTSVCPDPDTAARAWEIVKNSGVVRSMSGAGDISVEDDLWEGLPREDRIRFAFAGYCRPPIDASRSILIVGVNDGKVKGSIVQGVWLDPASANP